MQDIDLFLPDLLTFVPNCPDLLAYRWLREAATVICTRTKLWAEQDQIAITATSYTGVTTFADASILELQNPMLDGALLEAVTPMFLDGRYRGWQNSTDTGSAQYITQTAPDTVSTFPRCAGTLDVRLILKPSRTAIQLADFLLEHHCLLVAKGAASNLLKQPKTDFENPQLALQLGGEFTDEVDRLSVQARKGQQRAPLRTTIRY